MTPKGTRGKNDIGHLAATAVSTLKCLEIADYRVFSSCSCQLYLTEFSFLVELCCVCLFQRPGSGAEGAACCFAVMKTACCFGAFL